MAEFVFQINEVGDAGGHFSWPVKSAWVRSAFEAAEVEPASDGEIGQLSLNAHRNGDELLLHGTLTADIRTPCVRCLSPAPVRVDTGLVGVLALPPVDRRPAGRGAKAQVNEDEDDGDRLDPALVVGDSVHMDDWVREHIVLELPMRPVCGDDCNGLEVPAHIRPPEDFGAEQEVDPRLLPLMKLKDQVPSKKE